nr:uncharacterized protein LOC117605259 [Osmia lignaria]
MDDEKYYHKKLDGSYVVHFPNNKGLSKSEIEEMFSGFGNVLSVDDRGQPHGLCFVRYENCEDVIRCIKGFKDHRYIKILPHKSKTKTMNTKLRSQNKQSKNGQWNYQADSNISKSLSAKSTNNSNGNGMDNEDFSDTSFSSSIQTIDSEGGSHKRTLSLKQLRLKNLQRAALNNSLPSDACTNSSKKSKQISDMDEIPALVCTNKNYGINNTKFSKLSSVVVQAQEVIVANIHPSLSIHYLLHLFEKYNPIAVSLMMTIPKSGIRYCHVYYKTLEDAFATVEEFDKSLLRGKNLIVSTSQKLMEEAWQP